MNDQIPNEENTMVVQCAARPYKCSEECMGQHVEVFIQTGAVTMQLFVDPADPDAAATMGALQDRLHLIVLQAIKTMITGDETPSVIGVDGKQTPLKAPDTIPDWVKNISNPND